MLEQHLHVTPVNNVETSEFITGTDLATLIGLTAGTGQNSNEPWLHFELDGKTLYVAKKTFRYNVSWNHIQAVNAVYGERTVVIQGKTYKVRLLKGANSDPANVTNGSYDTPGTHGSEWNRLLYPLIPNPTNKPASGVSGEGIVYGSQGNYTEAELNIYDGDGRFNVCQERRGLACVSRGSQGVSYLALLTASTSHRAYGWRPVLELVE